ncbi:MAG: Holliday junction branch migration protein RuvA [Bacteroidales bacterium]|nr:Holliday junction branch migration protein RuvA [Bacteroidales bacterium]
MIDYIKGQIVELTPTELILENAGIGYSILISLQTYEAFQLQTQAVAYIHHYIREDEELYFGFATKDERELFRLLISVSGIGVASARMMLSTLTSEEIRQAILAEDVNRIKSVKGIGLKSAQRLVLELKDKVVKGEGSAESVLFAAAGSAALADEATTALVMLGFSKAAIGKVLPGIIKDNPAAKVEDLIKAALKKL